jgi:hypothetical protein
MVIILALTVTALPLILHFVVAPRLTAWAESRLPEARPVQTALTTAYPDKQVSIMDQTFYVPGNAGGKKRMLAVTLTGKNHLSKDDAKKVNNIICAKLSDNAKIYDVIILQSSVEKRFSFFFAKDNKTEQVQCNPPAANPEKLESTV